MNLKMSQSLVNRFYDLSSKLNEIASQTDFTYQPHSTDNNTNFRYNFKKYLALIFDNRHNNRFIDLYHHKDTKTLILEIDADSSFTNANEICFALFRFIEEHFPPELKEFYTISIQWC